MENIENFLQYILDQWELDTKDVQDKAEKLLNEIKKGE